MTTTTVVVPTTGHCSTATVLAVVYFANPNMACLIFVNLMCLQGKIAEEGNKKQHEAASWKDIGKKGGCSVSRELDGSQWLRAGDDDSRRESAVTRIVLRGKVPNNQVDDPDPTTTLKKGPKDGLYRAPRMCIM
ncbi:hypothetical protein HAX54_006609 [Datura stramonium]|uniref:Uncharacterized protein n=1 Tax=Datura stramonium TaxID=4076 RepID=A0ABS8TAI3_DATST|nr:hypothetical protein [Datura stramonium]